MLVGELQIRFLEPAVAFDEDLGGAVDEDVADGRIVHESFERAEPEHFGVQILEEPFAVAEADVAGSVEPIGEPEAPVEEAALEPAAGEPEAPASDSATTDEAPEAEVPAAEAAAAGAFDQEAGEPAAEEAAPVGEVVPEPEPAAEAAPEAAEPDAPAGA